MSTTTVLELPEHAKTSQSARRALSTSLEHQISHDPTARHVSTNASTIDIETPSPLYNPDHHDPYALKSRIKPSSELDLLRAKSKQNNIPLPLGKTAQKARGLRNFYETQNENITRWLKPVDEHIRTAKEFDGANHLKYQIAVKGSFAANIVLAILQIYGAISNGGSLSLFTTMADAIFDPLSNFLLILSNRAVKHVDARRFPSGKARLETTGNIVFCSLMTCVSFIIIVLSLLELRSPPKGDTKHFHIPSVVAVGVATVTKLMLFAYCWTLRNVYSQVRILWEDHRNDLFINGFGLMTSVGGSKLVWWIDPMGAIVLSVLISVLWLHTAYREFLLLIGVTADTQMQQWITYISMTHSPLIKQIDTVRAYHSGPRLLVEVDIVMDRHETLEVCHDTAEELQTKLESLPDVERAYVHIDFETSHKPEHFLKKEL